MNQLSPDYDYSQCFGIKAFSCELDPECYLCEYTHACHWAARTTSPDSGTGLTSYDKIAHSQGVGDQPAPAIDAKRHSEKPEYTRRDLADLLAFLLRMDEYTLKLAADALTGRTVTVSELARIQGVSRQAVHQKLLRAVKRYPEIKELLLGNLYRCRRIIRESASEAQRHKARGMGKQNRNAFIHDDR